MSRNLSGCCESRTGASGNPSGIFLDKVWRVLTRKAEATLGRLWPLAPTLEAMALRPYELHLELTNLCNANCVFCPYQHQMRPHEFMSNKVSGRQMSWRVGVAA